MNIVITKKDAEKWNIDIELLLISGELKGAENNSDSEDDVYLVTGQGFNYVSMVLAKILSSVK